MARTMTMAVVMAAMMAASPAVADNDHEYVNFRSDALRFNPYDYDVKHMTPAQRVAYHQQRKEMKLRMSEKLATANVAPMNRGSH